MTRRKAASDELVRLVLSPEGELCVDYRAKLPGRGAWVLPERAVLQALEAKPKILRLAFRQPVSSAGILEKVQEANRRALGDALSIAARAGALVGGGKRVREAIASKNCIALLFASDASARMRQDLMGRESSVFSLNMEHDCVELGSRIGKGPRSAIAVMSSKPGRHLKRELQRHAALR